MKPIIPTPEEKLAALEESERRAKAQEEDRATTERVNEKLMSHGYAANRHGRRAFKARNKHLFAKSRQAAPTEASEE